MANQLLFQSLFPSKKMMYFDNFEWPALSLSIVNQSFRFHLELFVFSSLGGARRLPSPQPWHFYNLLLILGIDEPTGYCDAPVCGSLTLTIETNFDSAIFNDLSNNLKGWENEKGDGNDFIISVMIGHIFMISHMINLSDNFPSLLVISSILKLS